MGSHNWTTYSAGQSFGGWTVSSGSVDLVKKTYLQSARNDQWIDLSGSTKGEIYQDITTTSGLTYTLRFAMAGNPAGGPNLKAMQVWWGGSLVDVVTFDASGRSGTNMGWGYHQYTVTAASAATHLEFKSLTNSAYGPGLDDVSLSRPSSPSYVQLLSAGGGSTPLASDPSPAALAALGTSLHYSFGKGWQLR